MKAQHLEGMSCPLPTAGRRGKVLTRIFIEEDGNLVVTDLWDEVRELLEGPMDKPAPPAGGGS